MSILRSKKSNVSAMRDIDKELQGQMSNVSKLINDLGKSFNGRIIKKTSSVMKRRSQSRPSTE